MDRRTYVLTFALIVASSGGAAAQGLPVPKAPLLARSAAAHEQEWIVADVARAIVGMTRSGLPALGHAGVTASTITVGGLAALVGERANPTFTVAIDANAEPMRVTVAGHIWAPATYVGLAAQLLRTASPPRPDAVDLNVRAALLDLRADVLLEQDARLSAILKQEPGSLQAHESAALLLGAFALRESSSLFADVRPPLSQMAAHLAVADALRAGSAGAPTLATGAASATGEGLDGTIARAVLTILAGRQRDAFNIVNGIEQRSATTEDRAWVQALRLRITGDWRVSTLPGMTRLEHLEYARALRARRGVDDMLDYLDRADEDMTLADWARIAFVNEFNVEAGQKFTPHSIDAELDEAAQVWSRLHDGAAPGEQLIAALNERPGDGAVAAAQIIDWGMWAAFHQRHLSLAIVSRVSHLASLGVTSTELQTETGALERRFGALTLYPIVLRWTADQGRSASDYKRALLNARPLVERTPELVTAAAWDYLLKKPDFVTQAAPLPLEVTWFTPAVPAGTAYDLTARSLRPGCPRPPTLAQAHVWALERPYDMWAVLEDLWLPLPGKPSIEAERKALGTLVEYDAFALKHIIDYLDGKSAEQIAAARALCTLAALHCNRAAQMLLLGGHVDEARGVYEAWIERARDRVLVSSEITWIMRYYLDAGNAERAAEIALDAASTGSARGLGALAEMLERIGKYEEAGTLYRLIAERYESRYDYLAAFLMREALRTGNVALDTEAADLLRTEFSHGMQRVVMHALEARPADGIVFGNWGPRPAASGLTLTDIIVGVDGWRVRTLPQYLAVLRLSYDPAMTFTVWRDGRYQEVRGVVPQRWFGSADQRIPGAVKQVPGSFFWFERPRT